MASETASGQIKGAVLREFVNWYATSVGQQIFESKVGQLSPDDLSQLNLGDDNVGILSSSWYPAHVIHALLDKLTEGVNANERERMIQQGAKAVMEATLHGIYRLLFRTMMSPDRYARYAQHLWDRYYDCGIMTKESEGPTRQKTTIRDWVSHHPVICDLNTAGARYIYEAMGCRDVSVSRISCVSHGGDCCSFVINWAER